MALLLFKDDTKQFVDYNTAAKIYQLRTGATIKESPEELRRLKELASRVKTIDFKKVQP